MGKPYQSELAQLDATYSWAATVDITRLVEALSASTETQLVAIGSGGSFSAAEYAAGLHEDRVGHLSKAFTPLQIVRSGIHLGSHGVLLLSASGRNRDIIGALRNVISREPRHSSILCLRRESGLSELTARHGAVHLVEMSPPTAKDGFLSTNSLVAFVVLLERAYAQLAGEEHEIVESLDALLAPNVHSLKNLIKEYEERSQPLWSFDSLLVLYGPSLKAAAIDLESKFSEASLGNIQLADFRNFAHGRHNWLSTRRASTGVLAIYSSDDRELARRTLRLIPDDVAVASIDVPSMGGPARLTSILAVLHLVGEVGRARGIDPGRPRVPTFGRQIYNLQAFRRSDSPDISTKQIAVSRKVDIDPFVIQLDDRFAKWSSGYDDVISRMSNAMFGGVLFDYDGTLCDSRDRFTGLNEEVALYLKRLISANVSVGIATGRGVSVRESLRAALDEDAWQKVLIGYYNGTTIASLDDSSQPVNSGPVSPALSQAIEAIKGDSVLEDIAAIDIRPNQISLQPKLPRDFGLLWRVAEDIVLSFPNLKIVRSSHSADIIERSSSKLTLLHALEERSTPPLVLPIGDMGRAPGNDQEVLSTPYSLSVDLASPAAGSCWNLAPSGCRGVQATLFYLSRMSLVEGAFTIRFAAKQGGATQ